MPAKSFGQFLLERGTITREMLLEAVEYQRRVIKPVCEVAVQSGRSSREEMARLDQAPGARDGKRKKDALRERMRAQQELEASWRTLAERGVFLVEALSKKGYVSPKDLDRLAEEYRRETGPTRIHLDGLLPQAPETTKIIELLIDIALDLFALYTGQDPELVSITRSVGEVEPGSYAFAQRISGDINVYYVFLVPPRLVQSVAARVLQEPAAAVDAAAVDALLEFLNIVVGNTCTRFSMRNYQVRALPPEALDLDAFAKALRPDAIVARARVPDGEFCLVYVTEQPAG